MPEITAAMVKALREETQQGMMECKKALTETDGDMDAARDLLRKKGLATAAKKADRETKEGLIAISENDEKTSAAMVEVVTETDFTARNEQFKQMVLQVADLAAEAPDGPVEASEAITAAVQDCFNRIRENMNYSRGVKISAPRVGTYLHHNGKVGVIVGVDGEISDELLQNLCMHIAFADPVGITPEDVPDELVEKERQFAAEQAAESGKPAEIIEKMVEGKVRKFVAERALMEQNYVRDDKQKIKQVLGDAKVTAFARYSIGA
jgi:elongation factor Ts